MNKKTADMIQRLADWSGLSVHLMPSGTKGGLRGPMKGTLWIRYDTHSDTYVLSPKGKEWQTPVQEFLYKAHSEPTSAGAGGYPRWRVRWQDHQVLLRTAEVMAEAQGVGQRRSKRRIDDGVQNPLAKTVHRLGYQCNEKGALNILVFLDHESTWLHFDQEQVRSLHKLFEKTVRRMELFA